MNQKMFRRSKRNVGKLITQPYRVTNLSTFAVDCLLSTAGVGNPAFGLSMRRVNND